MADPNQQTLADCVAPLYRPSDQGDSATFRLMRSVNQNFGLSLDSYSALYKWSTTEIDKFWATVWDETGIVGDKGNHVVDNAAAPADNPPWFLEAKMNWAENLLWCRSPEKVALIQATEPTGFPHNPPATVRRVSYSELYSLVADLVSALRLAGLKPGDRVAAYCSNCIESVAACLAATAIGCIWVSAAADFSPEGVLERFEQVQPSLLFAVDAVVYNAKVHPHLAKLSSLLSGLSQRSIIQPKVVVIHSLIQPEDRTAWPIDWIAWDTFVREGNAKKLGRIGDEIEWKRQSFDWPLWILFSSGTTGRPKAIVHRAGGMLLQAKKELAICADLQRDDVFFYYTTTGWMMWNFLVSGLSVGCTLVLYDGSPLRDPSYLWNLVDDLNITIFGTSAKYLEQLSKTYKPRENHRLSTLRHIYSTASPLAPVLFDFVYQHIHPEVLLASITGGTDICSLFAGMCTALPVYRGEIQCRMLGMAIESFNSQGNSQNPREPGELVCLRPFPCIPVGFWPLEGFGSRSAVDLAKNRFQETYFSQFKGIWYHGDHVMITASRASNGGGLVMLGRSDGVLNPGGIRFGSSELYDVVEQYFSGSSSAETIEDCLAVGQAMEGGSDERVILFVKLPEGQKLSPALEQRIKGEIRVRRSPRHVPARVIQVEDVPYTLNGKRVEVPIKKIINGAPVSSVNPSTLRNAECLAAYAAIGYALRAELNRQ